MGMVEKPAHSTTASHTHQAGRQSHIAEAGQETAVSLATSKLEQLERKEGRLWRAALFLLLLLAASFALLSWRAIHALPYRMEALPVGLIILVVLFGAYLWSRSNEIARLRGLVRGLEQHAAAPPSDKQLDQLFALVARSQQGYRDLIDTFDDLLFSISLDGEVQAANRSFADLVELPFSQIIGRRLDELVDSPEGSGRAAAEKALPRFLEQRNWSGTVCVRVKATGAVRYFDCVLRAVVKDNCVAGMSGLARDITRQRENETRFTELFETLQEGVYFTTPEGKLLDANRALVRLLGYATKDELLGVNVTDLYLDPSQRSAEIEEFELQGRVQAREITLRRKDGSTVVCLDTARAVRYPSGGVVRYQGTLVDITQRKHAEAALRESEERYRLVAETATDAILTIDEHSKILFVNSATERMFGYSRGELLGQRLTMLMPEYLRSLHENSLKHYLETGKKHMSWEAVEFAGLHKTGGEIPLEVSFGEYAKQGQRIFIGVIRDISQRRYMEKRLHAEREFARRLVESFPDLIVVLDTEKRYTYVSPRIKEVLGYKPEELVGQTLGGRTLPDDVPTLIDLYNDLLAGKRTHGTVEYRTHNKQGELRLMRATASPLLDESGQIAGVVASARDVTEIQRLEQQLLQSEKLAAMGQMIAGVAHELNNPLTAILGVSELLSERAADDATRRQLDLAHRQARRAAHIVRSLLAFSRPPAPGKAQQDLVELLRRTIQLHEHSLRANHIAVDLLPEANPPAVLGDANQLIQVFLNLITNAEQAIREVRTEGTLQIRLRRVGNSLQVSFRDNGVGISHEALPRLFDPFFTTKRPGRGIGLGLSICMAIVREHGGSIEAQSPPGGGALLLVTLPAASESKLAPPPLVASTPRQEATDLQGLSVLVVDDEESIRELVRDGLAGRGLSVDCVATAEEAVGLAARRPYDAVLCDMNLAGPAGQADSGRSVFDRLARSQAGLTDGQKPLFILMTGSLVDTATLQSLTQSGSRVLQKPFRISDLVALLGEALLSVGAGKPHEKLPS